MRRITGFVVAAVAVLALAGCGKSGDVLQGSALEATGVSASATPAFLAQSAERTVAVETGKVEAQLTAAGTTVSITGQFDLTGPAGSATLSTSGGSDIFGDIDAEVVFQDGVVYLKPDGLGALFGASTETPWLKFDAGAEGLGELMPGGAELPAIDPQELLAQLEAEGITVTEVGREDVRGTATTRYAVTVPADQLAEVGIDDVSFDVWVDDNGLVRRIESTIDAGATGEGPVTFWVELYDLGEPVTITVPPTDQVTDLGALGELFGN